VVGDGLKARHDADEAAQIAEGGQA
jgi:hypothetical protein